MKYKVKQGKRAEGLYDVLVYDDTGNLVFRGSFTSESTRMTLTKQDRALFTAIKAAVASL
jgi:hypothetical protein